MQNHPTPPESHIRQPAQPMNASVPEPVSAVEAAPDAAEVPDGIAPSRQQLKDFRLAVEAHFATLRAAQGGGTLDSKLVANAEATREGLDREVSRVEAAIGEVEGEPSVAANELSVIREGLRSLCLAQLKILELMRPLADGRSASQ